MSASGELAKAEKEYLLWAKRGNGLAQFNLGWMYQHGHINGQPMPIKACDMYLLAANQAVPVAAQETGHCYRDQIIQTENAFVKANEYYQIALENGLFAAYCDIAVLHVSHDKPIPENYTSGCEQAGAQGAIYAQEILIDLYANKSALNNQEKALFWLQQAAPKSAQSAYRLAMTLLESKQFKPEIVIYWFENAASKGYLPAYLETAALYFNQLSNQATIDIKSANLAKSYLWSQAWAKRTNNKDVPEWVAKVANEVPKEWIPDLEEKIQSHIQSIN